MANITNSKKKSKVTKTAAPVVGYKESDEEGDGAQHFGDDDQSIDEDGAFNSEDEKRYGSFFPREEEEVDESGDDENIGSDGDDMGSDGEDGSTEGDGGQYMLDLLSQFDLPQDSRNREKVEVGAQAAAATNVSESQFATPVVQKGNITLISLMKGLEDTSGFGEIQKSLKKIAQGVTTSAPIAKVVSRRADRKVHYECQSKEISRWLEAVQQNRNAETLDFRPRESPITRDNLIEKFVPTTDFEKAIHAALQEAEQEDEEAILKAEESDFIDQHDDLAGNEQTLEEYKKRRGQLAKLRALMFYHEQKRHRINKIKSKKYRRIRKKQKERANDSEIENEATDNPYIWKEMEEKEEYDRMKERMTLAHKNTSKWAKRILKRGNNVDVDTRKALSAQLKRGDDLLQKMKQASKAGDFDESDSEDLLDSARKVLKNAEKHQEDKDGRQGLFKLKFMQKGIEKQRALAKEEARQLLRELEANEKLDDYDKAVKYDSDPGYSNPKKRKVASNESMKEIIRHGELIASSLKFGKSNAPSASGVIDIDLDVGANVNTGKEKGAVSEHTTTMTTMKEDEADKTASAGDIEDKKAKKARYGEAHIANAAISDEENPWLSPEPQNSFQEAPKKKKVALALRTGVVDVERVLEVLDVGSRTANPKEKGAKGSKEQLGESLKDPQSISVLSQEELIRRAFATSEEKNVEGVFSEEKAELEGEENDLTTAAQKKREKDTAIVCGWGSWAGAGAPPRTPKSHPKHLQPPKRKPKRTRLDARRPNVIIREKRVKKTADKFMLNSVPYPYTSREEYERAMTGAVGKEWNVTHSVKDMTRPEIVTRAGKVIQPLSVKVKKHQRAPAKF